MYTNWPFGAKANTRTIHMSDIFPPIEEKFLQWLMAKSNNVETDLEAAGSWKKNQGAMSHNVSAFQINIQKINQTKTPKQGRQGRFDTDRKLVELDKQTLSRSSSAKSDVQVEVR